MSERTRDRHWVPPMELDPDRAAAVPAAEEEAIIAGTAAERLPALLAEDRPKSRLGRWLAGSVAEAPSPDAKDGVWVSERCKSVVMIPFRSIAEAGDDNALRAKSKEGLYKESESDSPTVVLGAFHTDLKLLKVGVRKRLPPLPTDPAEREKALKERGYAGKIYQTHGVANNDFLRVCGKDCEGTLLPSGPVLVADQLPNDHPVKKSAMAYVAAYEKAHGKGSVSTFGAHAWDAGLLLQAAVPVASQKAQPGTKEFRAALRDALEGVKNVAGAHGIFNMSPSDHLGLDQRAAVMVQIHDGKWVLQK